MSVFQFPTASNFGIEGELIVIEHMLANDRFQITILMLLLLLPKQIHLVYLKLVLVTC